MNKRTKSNNHYNKKKKIQKIVKLIQVTFSKLLK